MILEHILYIWWTKVQLKQIMISHWKVHVRPTILYTFNATAVLRPFPAWKTLNNRLLGLLKIKEIVKEIGMRGNGCYTLPATSQCLSRVQDRRGLSAFCLCFIQGWKPKAWKIFLIPVWRASSCDLCEVVDPMGEGKFGGWGKRIWTWAMSLGMVYELVPPWLFSSQVLYCICQ